MADVRSILKAFSMRPIAYYPIYAIIGGSAAAGLLLSQIVYWWYASGETPFYKSAEDFQQELFLGPKEFRNARHKLEGMGLIKTHVSGYGTLKKTYYTLNIEALISHVERNGRIELSSEKSNSDQTAEMNKSHQNPNSDETAELEKQQKNEDSNSLNNAVSARSILPKRQNYIGTENTTESLKQNPYENYEKQQAEAVNL